MIGFGTLIVLGIIVCSVSVSMFLFLDNLTVDVTSELGEPVKIDDVEFDVQFVSNYEILEKKSEYSEFEKNIDLAEPLGTETQLFIKLKNKEIISRMYNPREIKIGEQINFAVNLNKIHIFDNETKKIIK